MTKQLAAYGAFYTAVAAAGFLAGWHASAWLSSFAVEIDPRIERKYTK
ncbi:hypothetical protein [Mycobacterium sp. NPDC050853]